MNELINKALNFISADLLMGRSWLDVLLILTPSVILLVTFFILCFWIKNRNWRNFTLFMCVAVALVYLPFELLRQSKLMDRANTNVAEVQNKLQGLLNSTNLNHVSGLVTTESSANVLDDLVRGIDANKKRDLILVSWLLSENEKNSQNQIDTKQQQLQQSLAGEIKKRMSEAKTQIIESQPPVEKISESLEKRLDNEINQLISEKTQNLKQEIDHSLNHFKTNINAFVQTELGDYQQKLASVTEKNVEELRNYSSKASESFAEQINAINKESLQKIEATQQSIEGISARIDYTGVKKIAKQVKQLNASLEVSQKKNDIWFDYNECMRTAGILDFAGKENECKNKLKKEISSLK